MAGEDQLDRLRAAGATVGSGPTLQGVRWLRIRRLGGTRYIGAGDLTGLRRLAEAMERGRLPGEDPEPELELGKPGRPDRPGKPETTPPPHPVKDTNPGQVVADETQSKPKKDRP